MKNLPWSRLGRFYRGNLHTHTNRSDAPLTPAEAIAEYEGHGYDFVAITDHFSESYGFPIVDTRAFRSERFTTLIGAELHAPAIEVGERWHILAVGLPLDFAPNRPDEDGPALAARAAAAGAFVAIAHPAWYSLTLDDALSLEAAHAVEAYNETCHWLNDRGGSWHLLDMLLARGRRLLAAATDDAHFKERPDRRGAWVQVRSERLDPDALLAALKAGHFYSSQGPELRDVRVEGGRLRIACSPATGAFLSGRGSKAASAVGQGIEEAELPLEPFRGSYCRLTVVDGAGKRAWSNPIWLD
jgi:hypothetical protein